jgi:hypothetical protein
MNTASIATMMENGTSMQARIMNTGRPRMTFIIPISIVIATSPKTKVASIPKMSDLCSGELPSLRVSFAPQ